MKMVLEVALKLSGLFLLLYSIVINNSHTMQTVKASCYLIVCPQLIIGQSGARILLATWRVIKNKQFPSLGYVFYSAIGTQAYEQHLDYTGPVELYTLNPGSVQQQPRHLDSRKVMKVVAHLLLQALWAARLCVFFRTYIAILQRPEAEPGGEEWPWLGLLALSGAIVSTRCLTDLLLDRKWTYSPGIRKTIETAIIGEQQTLAWLTLPASLLVLVFMLFPWLLREVLTGKVWTHLKVILIVLVVISVVLVVCFIWLAKAVFAATSSAAYLWGLMIAALAVSPGVSTRRKESVSRHPKLPYLILGCASATTILFWTETWAELIQFLSTGI